MKNIINKRLKYILVITLLFLVINIAISLSYLNGTITNTESVSTIALKAGSLNIIYSSDYENIVASDISPGYSINKQFTITSDFGNNHDYYNRGIWYKIALIIEKNEFADDSLKYSLTVDNSSVVNGITAVESQRIGIKNGTNTNGISLGVGRLDENSESHVYDLLIEYPETGNDQSHEIGFEFKAHIEIIDTEQLTLTFNLDGGSFNGFTLFNNEIDVPINSTINLPVPDKEGYIFAGWEVVSGNGSANSNVISTSENDISLKALWGQSVPYEFAYTGGEQKFIAEVPGYYKIEAWGAQGGSYDSTYFGAFGGYTGAITKLNKDDVMYIFVGGKGSLGYSETSSATANGGYNGGATIVTEGSGGYATSGGGATDIRYFGLIVPTSEELKWNSALGLNSRIIVAGGGGGTDTNPDNSYIGYGGKGGGLVADSGTTNQSSNYFGSGGSQISGGVNTQNTSFSGLFGMSTSTSLISNAGGGGGGYYGGGSGNGYRAGGGGGSSFISGYAGVSAITSSTDRTHTGNTLHYSNKYFINGKMQSGINEGNGKAKITYLGSNYPKANTKLDNVQYIKDCVNGNSINAYNHWTELQAIHNGVNVAIGKGITGTSPAPSSKPYNRITDGDITYYNYTESETLGSLQCVTVDLTEQYDLDEIAVWHYYGGSRSYNNHSLYVSSDNTNWTTLIDNVSGVIETSNGIRVSAYE